MDDSNPHYGPHQIAAMEVVDGWAVLFETATDRRHARLVLTRDEAPGELLACWHGDPTDEWGVPAADLPQVISHVVWHVTTNTPPTLEEHG